MTQGALLLFASRGGPSTIQTPTVPDFLPEEYVLVDNITFGESLDTLTWTHDQPGTPDGSLAENVEGAVTVSGGVLTITTTRSGSEGSYTYTAGRIKTGFIDKYGYVEASIKLPSDSGSGHWGAFWCQALNMGNPIDTPSAGTEMDMVESMTLGTDEVVQTIHWNGYGDDHQSQEQRTSMTLADATSNFHTYGMHWTPSGVTMYIDGVQTWDSTTEVPAPLISRSAQQFLVLSTHVPVGGSMSVGSDAMVVERVTLWRSTVPYNEPELPA